MYTTSKRATIRRTRRTVLSVLDRSNLVTLCYLADERVLSLRELNRALLARQLLLERRRLTVPAAVERLAGLQAQWPPAPYVGLWSRLAGFERRHLVRALERQQVVKATLMRATLHLLSARDYTLVAPILGEGWLAGLERKFPHEVGMVRSGHVERVAAGLYEPRRRSEVGELMGPWLREAVPGLSWHLWAAVQARGRIVHAAQSAAWQTSWTAAFVSAPPTEESADDGAAHLVRRYLSAFGPATRRDLASWSGLSGPQLRPGLEALEPELRTFRDERGRTLLDLRRAPLPAPDTHAPVRFLPKWDSTLLAYEPKERGRILPEGLRSTVIKKNGDVIQTFLVDGVVAGAWRVERARRLSTLLLEPFEPLPRGVLRELREEGEQLLRFVEPEAPAYDVR